MVVVIIILVFIAFDISAIRNEVEQINKKMKKENK